MMVISHDEVPSWLPFIIVVCLLIIIVLLEYLRKIALRRENILSHKNGNVCSLPGCVHCNKTQSVLEVGRQRLQLYLKSRAVSEQDEVFALLKDIQHSLNQLSQQSKTETSLCTQTETEAKVEIKTSSPSVFFMRGLSERTLFSESEFQGLQMLRKNYEDIKLEFTHLYKSPLPETKALWKTNTTEQGKWEIAQLIDQGSLTRASTLCPITMNILSRISFVMDKNVFGNVSFSVVHPSTFIDRHCGSTNCRIRCHLGLQVPFDCCTLEVDDTQLNWEEGEVLCFNDAFPHSVSHRGGVHSGIRAILMVDLWHPDIINSQRKVIDFAFSGEN